ncbi:MAG: hypothetical protein V4572_10055 [Bacteroidota bacterium]
MRKTFYLTTILLLMLTNFTTFSQPADSTAQAATQVQIDSIAADEAIKNSIDQSIMDDVLKKQQDNDGGLSYFLVGVLLILVVLSVLLTYAGIAVAFTVLGIFIIFWIDILPYSAIIKLNKKTSEEGFKKSIILKSAMVGFLLVGVLVLLAVLRGTTTRWITPGSLIITVLTSGILISLAYGFFLYRILPGLASHFMKKYNLTPEDNSK